MGQNDLQEQATNGQMRNVNVLDYLVVLAKHKKFIAGFVFVSVVVAVVLLYLVLPRWYKSTASVMPPKQKNLVSALSAVARATTSLRSLGLGGVSDDLSEFQTIVKSRRSMESVVRKFDLVKVYKTENELEAIKELEDNMSIGLGKENVSLDIIVYDTDAQRAADMANYVVEMLNTIYAELSYVEAKSNREFLEGRYQQNLRDMKNAEDSLKVFQQKYGIYSLPEALSGKLLSSFLPFKEVPEVTMRYFELYRDLEIQNKILEFVLPFYEQVRLEEQRDTPSVIVLDTAIPADKPSKPRKLILSVVVLIVSFLLAYVLAFFLESFRKAKEPRNKEDEEKIAIIQQKLSLRGLLR